MKKIKLIKFTVFILLCASFGCQQYKKRPSLFSLFLSNGEPIDKLPSYGAVPIKPFSYPKNKLKKFVNESSSDDLKSYQIISEDTILQLHYSNGKIFMTTISIPASDEQANNIISSLIEKLNLVRVKNYGSNMDTISTKSYANVSCLFIFIKQKKALAIKKTNIRG